MDLFIIGRCNLDFLKEIEAKWHFIQKDGNVIYIPFNKNLSIHRWLKERWSKIITGSGDEDDVTPMILNLKLWEADSSDFEDRQFEAEVFWARKLASKRLMTIQELDNLCLDAIINQYKDSVDEGTT